MTNESKLNLIQFKNSSFNVVRTPKPKKPREKAKKVIYLSKNIEFKVYFLVLHPVTIYSNFSHNSTGRFVFGQTKNL